MTNKIDSFTNDNWFLSNFSPAEVEYEGVNYPTTEHAFQAAKTLDKDERKEFLKNKDPGHAKKLGRKVQIRSDWIDIRKYIMLDLLRQKFANDPLKTQLLDTGDIELIEGNWWGDTYWGVCKGIGENMLGKLLMKVRDELRGTEEISDKIIKMATKIVKENICNMYEEVGPDVCHSCDCGRLFHSCRKHWEAKELLRWVNLKV